MNTYQKNLYKEDAIRGESFFSIDYSRMSDLQTFQILPCHWHEEFEILYMTKGSALFYIDDESFTLQEGQALFVTGGRLHSGINKNGQPCSYDAIVFSLESLTGIYDKCMAYLNDIKTNNIIIKSIFTGEDSWEEELLHTIKALTTCFFLRKNGYQLEVKGRLLMLFSMIFANEAYKVNNQDNSYAGVNAERLKKVIQYIHNNYQHRITLDDLAYQVNMNRHYFCRYFKKHTGHTPIDYINSYKINQAAILIETTNMSIMEAGMESGFDNLSYFIKTFKKSKNCTPTEYRNSDARNILDFKI